MINAEFGQEVVVSKAKYSFTYSNIPGTVVAIDNLSQSALIQWQGEHRNNINWWKLEDLDEYDPKAPFDIRSSFCVTR
jgi:hypothetical protein